MRQITPFILLIPVRSEMPELHCLSLVRRMAPLLSRGPVQRTQKARGLSSGADAPQSYTTPVPPALAELTLSESSLVALGPPTAGCTLMPVGSFAPAAKKIP